MQTNNFKPKDVIKFQIEHNTDPKRCGRTANRSDSRLRYIETLKLHFPVKSRVLSIGCRCPSEINDLKEHEYDVVGIDIIKPPNSEFIVMDAHDISLNFKEKEFDFVYAVHSLEHMYDVKKVLAGIRKVSSKGCFVVLPRRHTTVSLGHPSIFDIMKTKNNKLSQLKDELKDFENFNRYDLVHYVVSDDDTECELLFKWS